MEAASLLELFDDVASAIRDRLDHLVDWGPADGHPGQYRHDVVADEVAIPLLLDAGLGVVSEESEAQDLHRSIVAVIDPIDGSTNAAIGLPWFATSICAVDAEGPLVSLVVNQATGVRYSAVRDVGAWRDGEPISPSPTQRIADALLMVNDLPPRHFGWRQFRACGAAALDLCAVADGTVDGFVDFSAGLAPWDHFGSVLVCREAGTSVVSVGGADLLDLRKTARTRLAAGATAGLCDALVGIAN